MTAEEAATLDACRRWGRIDKVEVYERLAALRRVGACVDAMLLAERDPIVVRRLELRAKLAAALEPEGT